MNLIQFENYSEDFKWDYRLHFPVPTLKYILSRTGQDLLVDFPTKTQALGSVVSVTRSAKNFLFTGRRDMLAWEYDLAHNIDLIYEMLEYILEYINFAFLTGNYGDIFLLEEKVKNNQAIVNAKANIVGAKKVVPYSIKFREGY